MKFDVAITGAENKGTHTVERVIPYTVEARSAYEALGLAFCKFMDNNMSFNILSFNAQPHEVIKSDGINIIEEK